jgi:OOP family OmpA-OmpF porin
MRSAHVRIAIAVAAVTAPFVSALARADAYAGAAVGIARQQLVCAAGAPCEEDVAAGRVFGGWQFNDRWGAELAWASGLADFTASDSLANLSWYGAFSVEVLSLSATWNIDLASVDLQLRAGIASVRGEFASATVGVPDSNARETRPIFGVGLRQAIDSRWTLRADIDMTDGQAYTRKGRYTSFTVGVERRF